MSGIVLVDTLKHVYACSVLLDFHVTLWVTYRACINGLSSIANPPGSVPELPVALIQKVFSGTTVVTIMHNSCN